MPLNRGDVKPAADIWGVDFEMVAPNGDVVSCLVTRGALDQLFKDSGEITAEEQLAVFLQWRDLIEGIASQKFDSRRIERGFVVVRPEDF
jgi:hypothetical protein